MKVEFLKSYLKRMPDKHIRHLFTVSEPVVEAWLGSKAAELEAKGLVSDHRHLPSRDLSSAKKNYAIKVFCLNCDPSRLEEYCHVSERFLAGPPDSSVKLA